jgi:hypothetical protein
MSDNVEKKVFILSIGFLLLLVVFTYGVLVGAYKYWPFDTFSQIKSLARTFTETGTLTPDDLLVSPAKGAPRERITFYGANKLLGGFYAFLGWDNQTQYYSVWIYNNEGEKLHTWKIDYTSLDSDGPLNKSDMPHALHILPDGSLILAFGMGDVMARIDKCGKAVWIKKGIFHHSLAKDDDGNMWTWRGVGSAYGDHQYIVKFDPESGSTIKEIDLIEDIIRPLGESSIIFNVRPDYKARDIKKDPPENDDIFHPNDVDILHSDIADAFPDFVAGDLLLSFRKLNLVAVVDPDTNHLKWWSHGPWIFQHDPDFTSDGKISVYDNNTHRSRSEIIKIDPKTREITNELLSGNINFYNGWMGKHQYLPNGTLLLVSTGEGRALVLSKNGTKLFEFNNIVSAKHNAQVENGLWLPEDYFDIFPSCAIAQ